MVTDDVFRIIRKKYSNKIAKILVGTFVLFSLW